MPALQQGDMIQVFGWVMLNKLDEGRYRVKRVGAIHGQLTYTFARPKGRIGIITHYASNVDPWLRDTADPDLNKIVKVNQARTTWKQRSMRPSSS